MPGRGRARLVQSPPQLQQGPGAPATPVSAPIPRTSGIGRARGRVLANPASAPQTQVPGISTADVSPPPGFGAQLQGAWAARANSSVNTSSSSINAPLARLQLGDDDDLPGPSQGRRPRSPSPPYSPKAMSESDDKVSDSGYESLRASSPSSYSMEVARRTDVGTMGQRVALLSNHWAWEGKDSRPGLPKAKVYRYSVVADEMFETDEISGREIRTGKATSTQKRHIYHRAFRQIRRDNTAIFCGNPHGYAYDGAANMFALKRLANDHKKLKLVTKVKMEKRNHEEDYNRKISMEFSFIDVMDLSVIDLLHYMDKETIRNDEAMKQTALQVIETFSNQIFYENVDAFSFAQFGQSNYAMLHDEDIARGGVRIGNGLYVVQGVNSSLSPIMGTRIWDNIRGITGAELLRRVRENNENNAFSLGMTIDLCTTAMYVPQNCTWLVLEILNKQMKGDSTGQTNVHVAAPQHVLKRNGISDCLEPWQLKDLRKHMQDLLVVPLHGRVRSTFKVSNITNCNETAHTIRFRTEDGSQYSVFEYYRQINGYTLQYPNWPLLVHETLMRDGSKRVSHYPIEVCEPVDMQRVVKRMSNDGDVVKEVIRHAALHPDVRMKKLNDMIKRSNILHNPAMQALGIAQGSLKQLEINGRVLNPPEIEMSASSQKLLMKKVNNGRFDTRNAQFYVPATVQRWFGMMILPESGDEITALYNQRDCLDMFYAFGAQLSQKAACHGMKLPIEPEYMTRDGKPHNDRLTGEPSQFKWVHLNTNQDEVKAFFEGQQDTGLPDFKQGDLIICIVPDAGKSEWYSWAKLLTHDKLLGVRIQIVKYTTFRRAAGWGYYVGRRWNNARIDDSLLVNLCLQLNDKLGGRAWNFRDTDGKGPKIMQKLRGYNASSSKGGQVLESDTMFLGMDVAHPKVDDRNKKARKDRNLYFVPSFVAMVGSMDHVPFCYHQASRAQPEHLAEIVDQSIMKDIVTEMIEAWAMVGNRGYPKNIILYRDGISMGQSKISLNVEVDAIREACKDKGFDPKIAVFLVVKRHGARPVLKDIPKGNPNNPRDPNNKPCAKNVKPGTVVDTAIVNPQLPEFFMVGHEGLMGTSCWVRVRVLLNELNLTADEYQALSYYLCYGYSRCAKPVSLPAPVMLAHNYADYTINTLFKTWEVMTGQTDRNQPTDVDAINKMLKKRSSDVLKFAPKVYPGC